MWPKLQVPGTAKKGKQVWKWLENVAGRTDFQYDAHFTPFPSSALRKDFLKLFNTDRSVLAILWPRLALTIALHGQQSCGIRLLYRTRFLYAKIMVPLTTKHLNSFRLPAFNWPPEQFYHSASAGVYQKFSSAQCRGDFHFFFFFFFIPLWTAGPYLYT